MPIAASPFSTMQPARRPLLLLAALGAAAGYAPARVAGLAPRRGGLRSPATRLSRPSGWRTYATLATEEETAEAPAEEMIVLGAPFEVAEYPGSTDEFVDAYRKFRAANNVEVSPDEARRDIQAFMSDETIMEKWRPILTSAAEEANKMTWVDYVNTFTSLALPLAVGFTFLPLLRTLGTQVPVINDVVIPNLDKGVDLVKSGFQKAVELPICLEFGDC